ncbi:MAG: holo-ACP synthase [Acidimicrobiia bacterium]|nr:holo-ACP synthase [Acidimicrobiia bacterium]
MDIKVIKGIGIDIVDIARMEKAIRRDARIVEKILSPDEISQFIDRSTNGRIDILSKRFIESIAARFAAKEALAKSLSLSLFNIGLHNIEILKEENSDVPLVKLCEEVKKKFILQSVLFYLSISHSDASAVATVLATS